MDVGTHEGCPYLVTEYASKGSLRDLLQHQSPHLLSVEESINILLQVGQALHYAHQQNIIHRDLKPENILFDAEGKAILADFGVATVLNAATRQTATMGTFSYMAPEQFRNTIAKQSDQYALGCVAYELFTGRMVFEVSDAATAMVKCLLETPTEPRKYNSKLPLSIEQAVLKALAKERADRHTDISSFVKALTTASEFILKTDAPHSVSVSAKTKEEWLKEGLAHYNAKNFTQALTVYERVIQLFPNDIPAYISKGHTLLILQNYKGALQTYDTVLQADSKNAYAWYGKGEVLWQLGLHAAALEAFEEVLRLDETHSKALIGKGRVLESMQEHQEALQAYEQAIYFDPNSVYAWINKSSNEVGRHKLSENFVHEVP